MQGGNLQFQVFSSGGSPPLTFFALSPYLLDRRSWRNSISLRYICIPRLKSIGRIIRVPASKVNIGAGSYGREGEREGHSNLMDGSASETSSGSYKPLSGVRYQLSIASVLLVCTLAFSLVVFLKGGPSALVKALTKSGFTAAFTLIFVSEIGDKTFFIAALLAMQYDKALVLFGSMGALSLMTVLSVVMGRIFHSVPAQFQTTLPIGEHVAVALLTFFGLKSIKNAWELPSNASSNKKESSDLGELVEAEELVKEKVAKKLMNPLELLWKSFSLVIFASPWGVASGAIAGHLSATSIAILGGAFLANYISEKQPSEEFSGFQKIEHCSTAQEQLDNPEHGFLQDSIRLAVIQIFFFGSHAYSPISGIFDFSVAAKPRWHHVKRLVGHSNGGGLSFSIEWICKESFLVRICLVENPSMLKLVGVQETDQEDWGMRVEN
ncbi:putative GDT1-like protein 2, chloroplastic [Cocos nucifera]|uniref:Putative GDT1-like protein 2, chloroplastic n=1 Tax=Cocos nucifera TaxID=13894 RepID=A0A8K0IM85_COCNU|nr:putative GDT1-like protein 2, chloroplastic [Cocos nucifera]